MIKSTLKIYNGSWQEYRIFNLLTFDKRKDGQLNSASCIISTSSGQKFKQQRPARLCITDGSWSRTLDYFAYFKMQKRAQSYWLYTVTLISVTRRAQLELIDGLRVIQNSNNSVTLYDTCLRLLCTTPLRTTSQSQRYTLSLSNETRAILYGKPSPEFSWSSRTLLWECLKDIGAAMGGYIPELSFANSNAPNGKYLVSFENTLTSDTLVDKLSFKSVSFEVTENEVCSELDSDISNIISTNEETASIAYPSQDGFISARTEETRLTTDNCRLILPLTIEKALKLTLDLSNITFKGANHHYEIRGVKAYSGSTQNKKVYINKLSQLIDADTLDITDYLVEYKKYSTLTTYLMHGMAQSFTGISKNNTIYWTEGSNEINISTGTWGHWTSNNVSNINSLYMLICSAVWKKYASPYKSSGNPYVRVGSEDRLIDSDLLFLIADNDPRNLRFRFDYIPTDSSTKLRATKQTSCAYEGVQVYNQRAEKVDSEALSADIKKTVNQQGIEYYKTIDYYTALADVLPLGTRYKEGNDSYEIIANEFEQTNTQNIKVTHYWSKNWAMLSPRLMQNKEYRNTNIPTDILQRNLFYEDFCVVSTSSYSAQSDANYKAIISTGGYEALSRLWRLSSTENICEVNNFAIYHDDGYAGVVSSCSSFAVANSIVFCGKTKNNVSIGIALGDDWENHEVVYANDSATMTVARIQFGFRLSNVNNYSLPYSCRSGSDYQNAISTVAAEGVFYISKSSAEQLNFTYQLHFVTDCAEIVVGEAMASASPLIKGVQGGETLKIWGLSKVIPKTATVLASNDGSYETVNCSNLDTWLTVSTYTTGYCVDFHISSFAARGYIGWAVTDNKNRLIFAYNRAETATTKRIYFNFTHKFHTEA